MESSRTGGGMDAAPGYLLRALSIGEIFDRAITIYIRHFVPLTSIVLTAVLPFDLLEAILVPDQQQGFSQLLTQMQHPQSTPAMGSAEFGWLILLAFCELLLLPIVNAAVAVGVASIYNSKKPAYAQCFATVLRRFWPIIGVTLLFFGMIVGVYFLCALCVAVIFVIGGALISVALPLAVIVFIIAGLMVLAIVALVLLFALALAFGTYAAAIESKGVIASTSVAFARLFNRREIRKALMMTLAYLGLNIGILLLSGSVELLADFLLHSRWLDLAASVLVASASGAGLTVILAVYYYDVRTRSEGLDLEVELAQLTAS